jgi:sigma-B regulation protein RsbU (phosphoserine phosphatase)
VRAGHDPAIFYAPESDTFEELKGSGIALGVDENWRYQENEKTGLLEGQIIMLGTDGIWEAHNAKGEMLGKNRIYEIIRQHAKASANEILAAIIDTLNNHTRDQTPEDDATLVIVKFAAGPL